jgi:hypothetical protein
MIHEILRSDLDFARGLISSNRPDTEILAFLASRGVELTKATQLLRDLHHGRPPTVQPPVAPRSDGGGAVRNLGAARRNVPQERHSHRRRSLKGEHPRFEIPWWFVILVGIALLALGYVLLEAGTQLSTEAVDKDKHELSPAPDRQSWER